jgi:hypothetical protein
MSFSLHLQIENIRFIRQNDDGSATISKPFTKKASVEEIFQVLARTPKECIALKTGKKFKYFTPLSKEITSLVKEKTDLNGQVVKIKIDHVNQFELHEISTEELLRLVEEALVALKAEKEKAQEVSHKPKQLIRRKALQKFSLKGSDNKKSVTSKESPLTPAVHTRLPYLTQRKDQIEESAELRREAYKKLVAENHKRVKLEDKKKEESEHNLGLAPFLASTSHRLKHE